MDPQQPQPAAPTRQQQLADLAQRLGTPGGAKLYQDNCALCHGSIGKGDGYGGSRLDPPPTNLTRPGDYKYGRRELAVYRTGRYGVDGTGMVPWDGILSNEELWCITHYVMFLQEED